MRALWAAAALTLVFAVWVGAGIGGDETALYVDDLATVAAALAAAAMCGWAATRHAGRMRLFWALLAGACGAWALGEGIWAWYDLGGGDVPVPSWADAAYLAALPPTAAALLVHPALHGRTIGRTRSLLDGLVLAASLFFVGWMLVLEPMQRTIDLSSLGDLVILAYPIGDVVIVFLVVLLIRGTTSAARLDLWCLMAALLLITISDAVYSYLANVQDYASGGILDTGWFAGYLVIALAALSSRARSAAESRAGASPSLTPAAIFTPFAAMLGALSLAAIRLQLGHTLDDVTLTVAFVLVGLVLVRQALLVIDLLGPSREPDAHMTDRLVTALGDAVATDERAELAPTPKTVA